jgi:hypothetical protein
VVALPAQRPRELARLRGVTWLRYSDIGLIARTATGLSLVEPSGRVRALSTDARIEAVAVSGGRIVVFGRGKMISIDPARPGSAEATALPERGCVLDAELSPDGRTLIWITAEHVYLRDTGAAAKKVADATQVADLAFSSDGTAWLWSAASTGAVTQRGVATPFPAGAGRARFRQAGSGIILRQLDAIQLWDPTTGTTRTLGGSDPAESQTWLADLVGDQLITLSTRTPGKRQRAPAD